MTTAISKARFILNLRELGLTNRTLLTACEKHYDLLTAFDLDTHIAPHLRFLQDISLQSDTKILFINPTTTPVPLLLISAIAKRVYVLFERTDVLKEWEAYVHEHKIHNVTCWANPKLESGWPAQAPFDYILCSHLVPTLSKNLFTQKTKRGKVFIYDPFGPYRECVLDSCA